MYSQSPEVFCSLLLLLILQWIYFYVVRNEFTESLTYYCVDVVHNVRLFFDFIIFFFIIISSITVFTIFAIFVCYIVFVDICYGALW